MGGRVVAELEPKEKHPQISHQWANQTKNNPVFKTVMKTFNMVQPPSLATLSRELQTDYTLDSFYEHSTCKQSCPALISNLAGSSTKPNKYMLGKEGPLEHQSAAAIIRGLQLL